MVRGRLTLDTVVIVVQAALPHIFDQQVFRKGLVLDIGVCMLHYGGKVRKKETAQISRIWISHFTVL